jgi:hypothetical protein
MLILLSPWKSTQSTPLRDKTVFTGRENTASANICRRAGCCCVDAGEMWTESSALCARTGFTFFFVFFSAVLHMWWKQEYVTLTFIIVIEGPGRYIWLRLICFNGNIYVVIIIIIIITGDEPVLSHSFPWKILPDISTSSDFAAVTLYRARSSTLPRTSELEEHVMGFMPPNDRVA